MVLNFAAIQIPAAPRTRIMSTRTSKAPWKRKAPTGGHHTKLTPESIAKAKAAAKKAGRKYPNLIDNMRAAQEQREREE